MERTADPRALPVEIREVGPQPYLGKRARAPLGEVGAAVQQGYGALYHELERTHTAPAGPPFLVAGFPEGGYLDFELGAPCATPPAATDGFEAGTLPGGKVAVTVHRGSYDSLAQVYPRLQAWIEANGHRPSGPPREVYLTPPGQEPVTEVVWPLAG